MKIGITFDLKSAAPAGANVPDDADEEFDSPQTIEAIAGVLRGMGHAVALLGDGREFLAKVLAEKPDFVFNFAEGRGVSRAREARVPAVLEMLGIPFTGSDPFTMAVTLDKDCAKKLVAAAGVAVPFSFALEPEAPLSSIPATSLKFPLVIKPAWEGSSKGIRNKCFVKDAKEIPDVIASLRRANPQPILLEEYIAGDEVTVGLLGNESPRILGMMHIAPKEAGEHFIYSLEIKREYRKRVTYLCPPPLPKATLEAIEQSARTAFRVLGCRDVARIDFRVRGGVPYFLEVNPLPGLNPDDSDLVIMAGLVGWPYERLVSTIVNEAFKRCGLWVVREMANPTILVLYNEPVLAKEHPAAESEHSVLAIADKIGKVLGEEGISVSQLALGADPVLLWAELTNRKPDAVFNLFEGNLDQTETESYVAGLLEWSGIPYTGSPFATLSLARAKHTTKYLFKGAGLPTADFLVVNELPMPACTLSYPVIVKPAAQDASVGIDQGSVCESANEVEMRVKHILTTYGAPVLVEKYIDGRELHVALMELPDLCTLPPTQILFPDEGPDAWSIYTYASKWVLDTPQPKLADDLPTSTLRELGQLAEKAYRLLGCRDYARVDFRMDEAGQLFILEVNPNPEISEGAGFADSLGSAHFSHHEFIVKLAQQALSRKQAPKPTFTPL